MQDRDLKLMSGWPALAGVSGGLVLIVVLVVAAATSGQQWLLGVVALLAVGWFVGLFGFIVNGTWSAR